MSVREEFPRTTCACEVCQSGCRTMPAFLGSGDLDRIVDYCGMDINRERFIAEKFCASEGALVMRETQNGIEAFRIPTIVPQQKQNGECVFLDGDGMCTIHPVAPISCSHADTHQTPEVAQRVVHAALHEIIDDASYRYRVQTLRAAGIVARPQAERKAAYAALEAEIREKHAAAGHEHAVSPNVPST
jgi:Fe-S-cluster containining protein